MPDRVAQSKSFGAQCFWIAGWVQGTDSARLGLGRVSGGGRTAGALILLAFTFILPARRGMASGLPFRLGAAKAVVRAKNGVCQLTKQP